MNRFKSPEEYHISLESHCTVPEGFRLAVHALDFVPAERPDGPSAAMNMTALILDEPSESFAAVFTRNSFPGAPVRVGRRLLEEDAVQGILVNNKIANVCTPAGVEDACRITEALERQLGLKAPLFPSSTGVIGWSLPVESMIAGCSPLAASLNRASLLPAAQGIMTTDAFPKLSSVPLGSGRISGMAKGAGMIEPNMATMLCFLMTDVSIPRQTMRRVLSRVVDGSFNRISVDSDQSTSDSVLFLSSRQKPEVSEEELEKALKELCGTLAEDVVRNGEGCAHVIRVRVENAADEAQARGFGKAIINSPLSKTAVFGNDPNVGRIVQAVGDYAGNSCIPLKEENVSIALGGEEIFRGGRFLLDGEKETRLSDYLKERALPTPCPGYPAHREIVEIRVSLGLGTAFSEVLGSDLSYEYVRENADYRT